MSLAKNVMYGSNTKMTRLIATRCRQVFFTVVFFSLSFGCATASNDANLKEDDNETAITVVKQYLNNVLKMEYDLNYSLLSKTVQKEWFKKGVQDGTAYAARMATMEKRLISYQVMGANSLSSELKEVRVIQRETFEDPTVHSSKYIYRMMKENSTWKIDQYIVKNETYNYLP